MSPIETRRLALCIPASFVSLHGPIPIVGCKLPFPDGSVGKESACNAEDLNLIPGLGRSPGEGNGYPLQYCCLEDSMDRGAWWATVHGITESNMTKRLLLSSAAAAAAAKSLQSCPTLCDPTDGSPSGSPVPGILQARTLEWVAISFSNA